MFRVIKESENVDERQHCFLVQTAGQESRYFSMETRQDLLKVESAWHRAVCQTVSQMGVSDKFSYGDSICWIYVIIYLNIIKTNMNIEDYNIHDWNFLEYNFSRCLQKCAGRVNFTLDRWLSTKTFCVPYICLQLQLFSAQRFLRRWKCNFKTSIRRCKGKQGSSWRGNIIIKHHS